MRREGFLFLVFEGIDGSGKSTMARAVADKLRGAGRTVRLLREPGGTPLGEAVRHLLLQRRQGLEIGKMAELLLYMVSRAQLVDEAIQVAARAGEVVILDRFYYSSVAYQGWGLGLDPEFIEGLGRRLTGTLEPHRIVLLDCSPPQALARRGLERDRIESRDLDYFARAREGYLAQARARPQQFVIIDAGERLAEVEQRVMESLADVL
ncbi:MAG: dTMP kinase [Planctomycetota bacterium]